MIDDTNSVVTVLQVCKGSVLKERKEDTPLRVKYSRLFPAYSQPTVSIPTFLSYFMTMFNVSRGRMSNLYYVLHTDSHLDRSK